MGINENIFRILKQQKMTQKEFSKRSGISESTISDWKRKGKTPGTENLLTISKTLGVSINSLLADNEDNGLMEKDCILTDSEKNIIEMYRQVSAEQQMRIEKYFARLAGSFAQDNHDDVNICIVAEEDAIYGDTMLLKQKMLTRRLRKLARLNRLTLDESEHASKLNLHLLKYLDYIGVDRLEYIRQYLSNLQPFMISEIRSQEKFDNAICVLDDFYRIAVYIKVDATKGEEIVVSFHESNDKGVARKSYMSPNLSYVYVFADSIGAHVKGAETYSINLFMTRGASTFPINVPAQKYDEDGFIVRYTYINNAIIDIANKYLEDLYSSDVDFSKIELFSSLHQLSFTSYGKDIFSNISMLIDSLLIQTQALGRQIADTAMCIYCSNVELLEKDKEELINTLKERYKVNSVRALPQILERVEINIRGDK